MVRVEKLALEMHDNTEHGYVSNVAKRLLTKVEKILFHHGVNKKVTILCAKGNNSADGYALGSLLLLKGFQVNAIQITPLSQAGSLCQEMAEKFKKNQGSIVEVKQDCTLTSFDRGVVVIDALIGTGFHGKLSKPYKDIVALCNSSHNFIISIDIASGINGDSGRSDGLFIKSDVTYYLECPKVGHFFHDGFESYKQLGGASFKLGSEFEKKLEPSFLMVQNSLLKSAIGVRTKTEHKYSVGQILIVGGAASMSGAANLAGIAALRSGAGIVKIFHPAKEFSSGALELIHLNLSLDNIEPLIKELERSKSLCIGPGLGRDEKVFKFLQEIVSKIQVPTVIDADALYFFDPIKSEAPLILTPHEGELKHLLKIQGSIERLELLDKAQEFADKHNVILVCKGAPTVVIAKGYQKVLIPYGNSAMATAGMGDVLSGVIASLLCQIKDPMLATISACLLHALAADKACKKKKVGLIASDCVDELVYFL